MGVTVKIMKEIRPIEIRENPVELFGRDWALVTAGNKDDFNTMTVSWGMIGNLWQEPMAEVFVRPHRFTHEFIEREGRFTISFFHEEMRKILGVMGTKSGRDIDKMHYPGLTPSELPSGLIGFKEAKLIVECEVVYSDVFDGDRFKDKELLEKIYPQHDLHTRYIGRITKVWTEEN